MNGNMEEEVTPRLHEEKKIWETLGKMGKENKLSREIKRDLCGRVVMPTVVYGSKIW